MAPGADGRLSLPDDSGASLGATEPLHILAGRGLIALRQLSRIEARLVMTEAQHLAGMRQANQHQSCGFASFTDFTREALQMSPRTTHRRLALHRTLEQSPPLAVAFAHAQLSSCKVLCLRPVARSDGLPFWIELAQSVSVRELGRLIREATQVGPESHGAGQSPQAEPGVMASAEVADDQDEAGGTVTFAAPFSAAAAWDQALAAARRVLGWEAPPHVCVEAILSEIEAELSATEEDETRTTRMGTNEKGDPSSPCTKPAPSRSSTKPSERVTPKAPRRHPEREESLARTFALVHRELDSFETLLDQQTMSTHNKQAEKQDTRDGVAAIQALKDLQRPLRVLQARLLRDLRAAQALEALGSDTLAHFVESQLGLSERSCQRLIAEAFLFEDNHELTQAFETGEIGLGQAFLINRVALSGTRSAFIRRARQVTHLQFAREIHFLEKLAEYAPTIWAEDRGPLPQLQLEGALRDALDEVGLDREQLQDELRSRGVEGEAGDDPATHPTTMRTLEALLELLILAQELHDTQVATGESQGTELAGTEAAGIGRPPTLALGTRRTTITFWAPESVLIHWNRSLALARSRWGPVPTWAAVILILDHVVREWSRVDPGRTPSETPVLERDDYRCQAPGCSARRRLEVHHVVFRSQGGDDADANKVTLCHAHHHHGIHDGTVRLQGSAPDNLSWEMGRTRGREPFMTLKGAKILTRTWAS
jgi:hypothetical protein